MSNNLKMAMAAILVILLGAGGYILTKDDDTTNSEVTSQNQTAAENLIQTSENSENPLGIDMTSLSQPYKITVRTTEAGIETTATVESDGKNTASTFTSAEGTTSIILVDGISYIQNPGTKTWYKFPASDDSTDTSDLNTGFTTQDIEELNNESTIVSKGAGTCSAGSCRIYEVTDNTSGDVAVIKVHEQTNRISDFEITSSAGEVTTITYDYTAAISIVAPEDAVEFGIDIPDSVPSL